MAATTGLRDVFVDANGLRHHLVARGMPGSPIVVMLHGLTQQARVFDGIGAVLAATNHVYALDVRGRGETEWGPPGEYTTDRYVADLEAVRAALGLERFALVGTSMGALIAMQYASAHHDAVTRLVMNDIGPDIEPEGGARVMRMLTSAPVAFPDLKAVVKYYREENAPVLGKRSDDEVLEYARWHVRKADVGVYTWKMDPAVRAAPPSAPAVAPWDAFRAVRCPVLVLRGAQSDILSAATAAKMAESIAECRVVEVPGVGHAPSLLEPEAASAMKAFLAG
jgi:pimeloyl-ACP methyl ester carboxylesterase